MPEQHQTSNPSWVRRIDLILLALMALLSVVVSTADFLGVLDGVPWLAGRIPTLTLLVAGIVAAYLVVERRTQLGKIESTSKFHFEQLQDAIAHSTSTVIDSLNGVELRSFTSGNELMQYVNKRLLQARDRVLDVSWSSAVGMGSGLNIVQQVNAEYERRMEATATRIPYREVFMFNRPGRKEKLRRLLDRDLAGYSCAYYKESNIPLMQFMIVDDEVIILSDQLPSKLAIRHPHIVRLFVEYYDDIWDASTKIKDEFGVHVDEVEKVLS